VVGSPRSSLTWAIVSATDEQQEQRVMDRAGENAEQFGVDANLVKAIFRLLIELNKVEQRENR
jgi:chorismate mutase